MTQQPTGYTVTAGITFDGKPALFEDVEAAADVLALIGVTNPQREMPEFEWTMVDITPEQAAVLEENGYLYLAIGTDDGKWEIEIEMP